MFNKVKLSKENQTWASHRRYNECENLIKKENETWEINLINETGCPTVWDSIACWPSTPAGVTAVQRCPDHVNNFFHEGNATKKCEIEGKWRVNTTTGKEWTDYTGCFVDSDDEVDHFKGHFDSLWYISLSGYSISLAALILAIFIMTSFKKLRCSRNTLHLNLFVSFVIRGVMAVTKSFVMNEGTGFYEQLLRGSYEGGAASWQCKLLIVVFNYAMVSNNSWIFVEGMYLYTLIFVAVFSENSSVYGFVIFGWVFPSFCVLPWVVVRIVLDNTNCWLIHPTSWHSWILKGPLLVTVVLNFFFFINIIRVLFTKLRTTNSHESRCYRHIKLAKSSLVLIPLFGVPYVVFLALQEKINPTVELVKLYFEMIFNSFNGFIVACLYCFLNGEVRGEMGKKWRKYHRIRLKPRGMRQSRAAATKSSYSANRGDYCTNSYCDTTGVSEETTREDLIRNNSFMEGKSFNSFANSKLIELKEIKKVGGGGDGYDYSVEEHDDEGAGDVGNDDYKVEVEGDDGEQVDGDGDSCLKKSLKRNSGNLSEAKNNDELMSFVVKTPTINRRIFFSNFNINIGDDNINNDMYNDTPPSQNFSKNIVNCSNYNHDLNTNNNKETCFDGIGPRTSTATNDDKATTPNSSKKKSNLRFFGVVA